MVWPNNRLTVFEVARLVGARALQIALGAPVLVESNEFNAIDLGKHEFKQMIIPITVKRRLPSGKEVIIDIKAAIKNWLESHNGEI